MLPNIWGPSLWTYLHLLSANYPEDPSKNEKNYMKNFIKYLGHTLPCDICKNHYFEFMTEKRVNIGVTNKKELLELFWNLHNNVNVINNKPELNLEDFLKLYDEIIKYDKDTHFNIFKYRKEAKYFKQLSLVLGILLIIVVIMKSYHIFIQKY